MIPALYLGLIGSQLLLCLAVLRRRPTLGRALAVHLCLLGSGVLLPGVLVFSGGLMFLPMQLVAWLVFLLWPALLLGGAWLLRRAHLRWALASGLSGALVALVATWGVWVEPHRLEVSHQRIASPKLQEPLRLVLVADLQAERWGRYERRVLAEVARQQPDLVLFAGDYLQPDDMPTWEALRPALREALVPPCAAARLGCWAVRGDVDPTPWASLFAVPGAQTVPTSATFDLGPLTLTALDLHASRQGDHEVPAVAAFHVVLGHAPDFALGAPPADLLLAGHVHGGQVRLPGWGPLLTLTDLPRGWAVGRTDLPGGGTLIVSRGIGLERGDAPRLRLFCRPELVVIDLAPG
ncbi:MAG: hypothetical protein ABIO70_21800 [Pseudomonadota bacterium]